MYVIDDKDTYRNLCSCKGRLDGENDERFVKPRRDECMPRVPRGHALFLVEVILGDGHESKVASNIGNCCGGPLKASLERGERRGERGGEH